MSEHQDWVTVRRGSLRVMRDRMEMWIDNSAGHMENDVKRWIKTLSGMIASASPPPPSPPEGAAENTIGAAELAVGQHIYLRIEKLMDAKPGTTEAGELAYLAAVVEGVEEYGASGEEMPTPPSTPAETPEAIGDEVERVADAIYTERGPRVWDVLHDRWIGWADLSRYAKTPFLKTAETALSALHQAGKPADGPSKVAIRCVSIEKDDDCGCQVKRYEVNSIDLEMHVLTEGGVDAHLDGGDWGEASGTFPTEEAAIQWAIARTTGSPADGPSSEGEDAVAPEGGLAGISATHERVSGLQHGYQLGLVGDRVELNRLIELHWREIRDERAALAASQGQNPSSGGR